MNSMLLYDQIYELLRQLVDKITIMNGQNLTNESVYGEDLLGRIFNALFKIKLSNTNINVANVKAIDQKDEFAKTVLQVTGLNQKFAEKKENTIEKFKSESYRGYKLYIVFLTNIRVSSSVLNKEMLDFDIEYEAWDFQKLLNLIQHAEPKIKLQVLQALKDEAEPLGLIKPVSPLTLAEIERLKALQPVNPQNKLVIDRAKSVKDLFDQTISANCLVVGKPGIGKSYLLNEFNLHCWFNGHPCFTIKINELIVGDDKEINTNFGLVDGSWIDHLRAVKGFEHCFLVFDAYDTAKDHDLKKGVLLLIKSAISLLPENWRIVVSARTYDAYKSQHLLQLFNSDDHGGADSCNRFEVEELNDQQLENTLSALPQTLITYNNCGDDLKILLHIPYFLGIFENVVAGNFISDIDLLKNIKTEEQLLQIYWNRKILNSPRSLEKENLLFGLTEELFKSQKLSIKKSALTVDAILLTQLISDGILAECGVFSQEINYTHNILFDYAVAVLILEQDKRAFTDQIKAYPKNPFLFRPSYWYLLSKMWDGENENFWKLYFHIETESSGEFRLIQQILFNAIVSFKYVALQDLDPLFLNDHQPGWTQRITKFLQALIFTKGFHKAPDGEQLLLKLSILMQPGIMTMTGFMMEKLFEKPDGDGKAVTQAFVNYFNYILSNRQAKPDLKYQLDWDGQRFGVDCIARAIPFANSEVSGIIDQILDILKEDRFPINYFTRLCHQIGPIMKADEKIGTHIFTTIYLCNENSQEENNWGSALMNLKSTRAQNFHMCHYALEQYFPEYLNGWPLLAIHTGVDLVNQLKGYYFGREPEIEPVVIGDHINFFVGDGSIGEWDNDYTEGVGIFLRETFNFLEERVALGNDVSPYITIVLTYAHKSFIWREVIKLFKNHPELFKKQALQLLNNTIFMIANETTYECGELLKALSPFLNDEEIQFLEKKILSIANIPDVSEYHVNDRISTMLCCLPFDKLMDERSNVYRPENAKIVNLPILEQYSGPAFLEEAEYAVEDAFADQDPWKILLSKLSDLVMPYIRAEATVVPLAIALEIFGILQTIIDLKNSSAEETHWNEISDYHFSEGLKLVCRSEGSLDFTVRAQCFLMVKSYLEQAFIAHKEYQKGEMGFNMYVFTPNTRVNAIQALVSLSTADDLPGIGDYIIKLLKHPERLVRAHAVRSLNYFYRNDKESYWKNILTVAEGQTDELAWMYIVNSINCIEIFNDYPENFVATLSFLSPNIGLLKQHAGLFSTYCHALFNFLRETGNKNGRELLSQILINNNIAHFTINHLMSEFEANNQNPDDPYIKFLKENIIYVIKLHIDHVKTGQDNMPHYEVIDSIIMRMYLSVTPYQKSSHQLGKYFIFLKELIETILIKSFQMETALMVAHSGYYLVQLLELFLPVSPKEILKYTQQTVELAAVTGFTQEHETLKIILRILERYLTDYKEIILADEQFEEAIHTINLYTEAGWQEALELTWKLNEII